MGWNSSFGKTPPAVTAKRVRALAGDRWEIACRTWRAEFATDPAARTVTILDLRSGYAAADLAGARPDRHGDHALHRAFLAAFIAPMESRTSVTT